MNQCDSHAASKPSRGVKLRRHIRSRFISGVFILIPLGVTLFVLKLIFTSLEAMAFPFVAPLLQGLPHSLIVLIAIAMMLTVIYMTGQIATFFIGQRMIRWGESLLLKIPLIKSVYITSKQVVEIFSANSMAAFKAVVLVAFPHPASLSMGFVTGTMLDPDGMLRYRIFVPTTPNPTSGFLVIMAGDQVQFTDISVESGIRMIVSGGMLAPTQYKVIAPLPINS